MTEEIFTGKKNNTSYLKLYLMLGNMTKKKDFTVDIMILSVTVMKPVGERNPKTQEVSSQIT